MLNVEPLPFVKVTVLPDTLALLIYVLRILSPALSPVALVAVPALSAKSAEDAFRALVEEPAFLAYVAVSAFVA